MNVKKILAVINATYAVAKRKPEKNFFFVFFIHFFIPQFKYMNFIIIFIISNSKTFLKNSKKITNLLLKQQSTFTCSGDIVFTREIDRLGPGGHESEAKVHTSFRPSAGPCKNLRGGGGC